tara:strand:- start:201 stop:449 length:249 start_codon:yes stop_codon:yes gene_type:complete
MASVLAMRFNSSLSSEQPFLSSGEWHLGQKPQIFFFNPLFRRFPVEKLMGSVENRQFFPQDSPPSARLIPRSLTGPAKSKDI